MARLRVRAGGAEVEIDSRDFYVDNDTVGEVIDLVRAHLPEAPAAAAEPARVRGALDSLEEAELPDEPPEIRALAGPEIPAKIETLRRSSFFAEPRTAADIVEQMRAYGWSATLLDVSKALARMSGDRRIGVYSRQRRNYYTMPQLIN